jgi:hypothetical protein
MSNDPNINRSASAEFERQSARARTSFVGELWHFIITNKRWWLLPILISIALVAVLVALHSTGVAPFIYTLF